MVVRSAGIVSAILVALGVALSNVGIGIHPIGAWLIPLGALWMAPLRTSRSVWISAVIGFGFGFIPEGMYLLQLIHLPVPIALLAWLGQAMLLGGIASRWRRRVLEGSALLGSLEFAAIWTLVDALVSLTGESTATSLANTQVGFLPFAQLASIGGYLLLEFFLFFLVALGSSGLYGSRRRLFASAAGFLFAIGWGQWRLATIPSFDLRMAVGVLAGGDPKLATPKALVDAILADSGASAIVLPEKLAQVDDSSLTAWDREFSRLGERTTVVGLARQHEGTWTNVARVYDDRSTPREYVKQRLVPGIESKFRAGNHGLVLPNKLGVLICRDLGYPDVVAREARDGAEVLLVPAWDFGVDAQQAELNARMRSIESGVALVRCSREGLVSVNNAYGQTALLKPYENSGSPRFIRYGLFPYAPETLARRGTGWMPIFCVLILAAGVFHDVSRKRKALA